MLLLADRIDRFVEMLHHMEAIVHQICLRHRRSRRTHKRRPHGERDHFDLRLLFRRQSVKGLLGRRLFPAFRHFQCSIVIQIAQHGSIVVPAAQTLLVQPNPFDVLQTAPLQSTSYGRRLHIVHLMPGQFQVMGGLGLAARQQQQIDRLGLKLR